MLTYSLLVDKSNFVLGLSKFIHFHICYHLFIYDHFTFYIVQQLNLCKMYLVCNVIFEGQFSVVPQR